MSAAGDAAAPPGKCDRSACPPWAGARLAAPALRARRHDRQTTGAICRAPCWCNASIHRRSARAASLLHYLGGLNDLQRPQIERLDPRFYGFAIAHDHDRELVRLNVAL